MTVVSGTVRGDSWVEYEEKDSDVALGAAIVADGARRIFDTAMIISADGDMASAVRELKDLVPTVRVIAAFPPNRNSSELMRICDAFIRIGDAKIRQAQLPETVRTTATPSRAPGTGGSQDLTGGVTGPWPGGGTSCVW